MFGEGNFKTVNSKLEKPHSWRMSPNPDGGSNGFVNNAFEGSNSDLSRVGNGGGYLNEDATFQGLDVNQNQISLKNFKKFDDDYDDLKKGDAEKGGGTQPPPTGPQKECHARKEEATYEVQTAWAVLRQMMVPFIIAGFGSVFAGIVLNMVTKWEVFQAVSYCCSVYNLITKLCHFFNSGSSAGDYGAGLSGSNWQH